METLYAEFISKTGKRIKKWRLRRDYTRECLAEMANISPKFLYEIEVGKKGCSAYVLYMLASALDINVNVLVQDETEKDTISTGQMYQLLETTQKEKVYSILKTVYEIIQELEK
ncbi:MAG: helix-turn-helix domain-containing protein [Lachnospiraceae bacterium]